MPENQTVETIEDSITRGEQVSNDFRDKWIELYAKYASVSAESK